MMKEKDKEKGSCSQSLRVQKAQRGKKAKAANTKTVVLQCFGDGIEKSKIITCIDLSS
jgi:hypothetical protein